MAEPELEPGWAVFTALSVHLGHYTAFDVEHSQDLEDLDSKHPCPEEETHERGVTWNWSKQHVLS